MSAGEAVSEVEGGREREREKGEKKSGGREQKKD